MWHLGLVVLKHRKAAKAWSLRFEILCSLSKVQKFLKDPKVAVNEDNIYEDDEEVKSGVATANEKDVNCLKNLLEQELSFCTRVNKYHPRNYYLWTYRQRIVLELLKPLFHKHIFFGEKLLLEEVEAIE